MFYFANIKNLDELKAQYRRLAMMYHPDRGGSVEIMQAINAEHDRLFDQLKQEQNARAEQDESGRTRATTETPEEFRTIISALLKIPGIIVELCGSWLWITGDTRPVKDALKAAGCRWSSSKKAWYWRHPEDSSGRYRGKSSMGEIRDKYGSQVFSGSGSEYSHKERLGTIAG